MCASRLQNVERYQNGTNFIEGRMISPKSYLAESYEVLISYYPTTYGYPTLGTYLPS
jgi:hypothetical protein